MTVVAPTTRPLLTLPCRLGLTSATCSIRCLSRIEELLSTMPKDTTQILAPLKKHRVKLKEKSQKFSPGTVTLQVLGSGARGAPRSLYLFTDQSRYLFNCGEGSQRLAHEHKMKLSKLEHIFITHGSWENIGGLPGVALTIQDVGVPEITLHGPEGVVDIFNAMRKFVVLRNLRVNSSEGRRDSFFEDNAIKVTYVPISIERNSNSEDSPRSDSSSNEDDTDYYSYRFPNEENNGHDAIPQRRLEKKNLPSTTMNYIVRLQPRPGSLCLAKCVEAGVTPGPLLGRLKAGEDVTLDNGKVVRSADVTLPTDLGPQVLVVECPSLDFLDHFVSENEFKAFQNCDDPPYLIAHFTPPHVMADQRYKDWMGGFHESTKHLLLNESNECMGSIAVHRVQHKLNLIDPDIFPLLGDSTGTVEDDASESLIRGRTHRSFNLRPRQDFDSSPQIVTNPSEYIAEVMNIQGFSQELDALKMEVSQVENTPKFPRVTFLGTGSCIPNKTRNTSGILVDVSEDCSVILDCGEGTYGQLVRFFGPDRVDAALSRIRGIYVSHLHADHHIGLVGLLKGINKLNLERPLFLMAPRQINPWLKTYQRRFETILNRVVLVPNADLIYKDFKLSEALEKDLLTALNLDGVETSFVRHCPNAFGVSLRHSSGWKLVYSGDTMPCEELVQLGFNCDLLIHEATMEDELEDEAKIKLHSTMSQALSVSRLMRAKFVILTHFSQRYAKLPRFSEIGDNVGIAFDNMTVSFDQLKRLVKFYPALKLMFQDDCDELEAKALKRQLKLEREEEARKKAKNLLS